MATKMLQYCDTQSKLAILLCHLGNTSQAGNAFLQDTAHLLELKKRSILAVATQPVQQLHLAPEPGWILCHYVHYGLCWHLDTMRKVQTESDHWPWLDRALTGTCSTDTIRKGGLHA